MNEPVNKIYEKFFIKYAAYTSGGTEIVMIFSRILAIRKDIDEKRGQKAILEEIKEAKKELDRLSGIFNLSNDGLQSDRLIFQIKAAEIKYRYLCSLAKEKSSRHSEQVQ